MKADRLKRIALIEELFLKSQSLREPLYIVEIGARKPPKRSMIHEPYYSLRSKKILGFEADRDEYEQLVKLQKICPDLLFYPYAMGKEFAQKKIYFTKNPRCSSLYEPDIDILKKYENLECAFTEREENVQVKPLSAALLDVGWDCLDFLKADIQGAELDVLCGLGQYETQLLSIVVEVEFEKMVFFSSFPKYRGRILERNE